jgi:hypothetical protein
LHAIERVDGVLPRLQFQAPRERELPLQAQIELRHVVGANAVEAVGKHGLAQDGKSWSSGDA